MELSQYVERLQHELQIAAQAGGDDARALAERLIAPLDSATRLVLLEAMAAAADEITRDLAPGSVEVRLRGLNPSFVVTLPPTDDAFEAAAEHHPAVPAVKTEGDEGGTSRINLRLPESLKVRAEEAADKEGLSVNAWLVRAVAAALDPGEREGRTRQIGSRGEQRYTGWVR
jgi:HicB-like protein involved in pilus formation